MKIKYLKILVAFLAVFIVWHGATLLKKQAALDKNAGVTMPASAAVSMAKQNMTASHAIKTHLFGEAALSGLDALSVKGSDLNIQVVGIFFAEDQKASHAMLKLSGGEVKLFHVGDKLPGGAVIRRITKTSVLLMQEGELRRLSLPTNEVLFSPPEGALKQNE